MEESVQESSFPEFNPEGKRPAVEESLIDPVCSQDVLFRGFIVQHLEEFVILHLGDALSLVVYEDIGYGVWGLLSGVWE